MIYQNEPVLKLFTVVCLCIALIFALVSCADRDIEMRPDISEGLKKASEALARAEALMKEAGINISFSDLGSISEDNLVDILPSPEKLSQLEKDHPKLIQDAIVALYEVFEAFPALAILPTTPMAPAIELSELSNSDVLLLHLHNAYLYVLKIVGKLALEGMGPDGELDTDDDLFMIDFPESFEEDTTKYKFELTDKGRARMDEVEQSSDPKPEDYLNIFSERERQVIIDSLFITLGARVRILPVPSAGIKEQTPQVDRTIYRRDTLFHLEKAAEYAEEIAPDLKDSIDEFNRVIAKNFAEDFLRKAQKWHFDVENIDEVEERLRKLIEKE